MSILKVAKLGNPTLRRTAHLVKVDEIATPSIQQLIRDMIETMREYGGVGLAAPQVHEPLQIIIIEALEPSQDRKGQATPLTVLINPTVTIVSKRLVEDWEGCLSVPDLRGPVPRHWEIGVEAYDTSGKPLSLRADDFFGRVIQHEHDHLMGKVFLDRMRTLKSLTYLQEFSRYWERSKA